MTILAGSPTDPLGCFATGYRGCRQASFMVELGGVDTYRQITLRSERSHGGCRVSDHETYEGNLGTSHSSGSCAGVVRVPAGLVLRACRPGPDWTIDEPVPNVGRA